MNWYRMRGWVSCKLSQLRKTSEPATVLRDSPTDQDAESLNPQQETLGNIIMARLLLELPEHHQTCIAAWQANDLAET